MQRPLEELYSHQQDEIHSSSIKWRNFDEDELYSDRSYPGFSVVNETRTGEKSLDQAILGKSAEEYIFISRDSKDILECERDKVQVLYAEKEDPKNLL